MTDSEALTDAFVTFVPINLQSYVGKKTKCSITNLQMTIFHTHAFLHLLLNFQPFCCKHTVLLILLPLMMPF